MFEEPYYIDKRQKLTTRLNGLKDRTLNDVMMLVDAFRQDFLAINEEISEVEQIIAEGRNNIKQVAPEVKPEEPKVETAEKPAEEPKQGTPKTEPKPKK